MTSITCATDVHNAFPHAKVGNNGIFSGGGTYMYWDDDLHEMRIDGTLSATQFLAVAYWLAHRDEFPVVDPF